MRKIEGPRVGTGVSSGELWEAICSGDQRAWRDLVHCYKNLVYSVCLHVGLSQAESADVFQETWLQLFNSRKSIQDPSKLPSWLITTTRREAIRIRQKSSRNVENDRLTEEIDPAPLPDSQLESLEQQACLEMALGEIDPPCRNILHSFFFADDDLTYEAIATNLGYAPNTLGAKRRRCLERLRQILVCKGYAE